MCGGATLQVYMYTKRRGFTLIELLVVIAIIGILASIVMMSVNSAQVRAKDSARIQETKELEKAMQMYYHDTTAYPHPTGSEEGVAVAVADLSAVLVPNYISVIPQNLIDDGDQYIWGTPATYGLEDDAYALNILTTERHGMCKTGVNVQSIWWSDEQECGF